ncbi:hypothetical protein KI387_030320, partial [Taxus chinensis]
LREGFESVVSATLAIEFLSRGCKQADKAPLTEGEPNKGISIGSRAWVDIVK